MAKFEDIWKNHRSIYLPLLPVKSVDVQFYDLKFSVNQLFSKKRKGILHGLTGDFKAGELTAIMGPSGAGKSSLLNILTGFQTDGVSGRLVQGGKEYMVNRESGSAIQNGGSKWSLAAKASSRRKYSAYIMQQDQLPDNFTALEIMMTAAQLKLGNSITHKARQLLVEDLLDSLKMSECKNTICCKLSGGQRKRLSIALELIDNPSVLYLDEPTTGLDSSSCSQLISLLLEFCRRGRTIICTIHQPSAKLFEMFDHVYVVSFGSCVYQGSPDNVVPYLAAVNLHCPKYHNPADFLLDVVCGEFGLHQEELMAASKSSQWRISNLNEKNKKRDEKEESLKLLQKTVSFKAITATTPVIVSPPSEIYRTQILIRRIMVTMHRDWTCIYLKIFMHIIVGIVIGLIFLDCGIYGNKAVSNIGFFMALSAYVIFVSFIPATLKFPAQIEIIKKERFNNWYTFRSFFIAFFVVNVPIQIFSMNLFIFIGYFLSSQISDVFRISGVFATGSLTILMAEHLGIALGTFKNPANAIFIGSVGLAVMLLFAGYAIFLPHMSPIFYYFSYLTVLRYTLENLVILVYGFSRDLLICPDDEMVCYTRSPEVILNMMGFDEKNLLPNLGCLSLIALITILFSYFWVSRQIRKT